MAKLDKAELALLRRTRRGKTIFVEGEERDVAARLNLRVPCLMATGGDDDRPAVMITSEGLAALEAHEAGRGG